MTNFWSSIHCLRGIAALLVVIHHIPQYLNKKLPEYSASFEIGAIGVDVFFAISGFVMYHTASKPNVSAKSFILDRMKRVMPLYWLITLLLGATTMLLPSLFSSFQPSWEQIIKSILFIPIYSESGMIRPVLAMGWTLHYEMLFYFFTGMCLLINFRINAALISTAVLTTASIGVAATEFDYQASWIQVFAPLVIEFCFGALIAHITKNATKGRHYSIEGILFILAGSLFITSNLHGYDSIEFDRLGSWGLGSALIVLGIALMDNGITTALGKVPLLKWIFFKMGDSSYALYLTHGISFSISYQLGNILKIHDPITLSVILLFVALTIGHLTHVYLEKPISNTLKRPMS